MQAHTPVIGSDKERADLRQLIEQQTKEFEAKNGPVITLDIIRKEQSANYWKKTQLSDRRITFADAQNEINQTIMARYATAECLPALAQELGLPSADSLTKRASRLGVQRGQINHPNVARAERRMEKVEQLLESGEPVKTIAKKLDLPERSVRYYRQRLAEINKAADFLEQQMDSIEARSK